MAFRALGLCLHVGVVINIFEGRREGGMIQVLVRL